MIDRLCVADGLRRRPAVLDVRAQTTNEAKKFFGATGIRAVAVYGGAPMVRSFCAFFVV